MARKANIAREEIHQACWELIEKNSFPNIPRLTDYFLKKDGRRCSNTTFLNAITEWEEIYKEQQQHELSELNDVLLPAFKHFSREVTQSLGKLLDEKASDIEQHQHRKQESTEGGYLSLSTVLIDLQAEHEKLQLEHQKVCREVEMLKDKSAFNEQRYEEVLSQNAVLTSQLKQEQKANSELTINLAQKEVDLAKQDNQLTRLKDENRQLAYEQELHQQNATKAEVEKWDEMSKKLDALASSMKTMQRKDRGSKQ
ncbi:MAG: hypothetical protein HWE24_15720 [Oceanospirillaceae bacterium]|nr:hypothetical protein [Oceanospirillaceae bacterium]